MKAQKLLSLFLAAALAFSLLPGIAVFAETLSGECGAYGDNLKWSLDAGVLTITGSGDMYDYSYEFNFRAPWYPHCGEIRSVVLTEGLTSIGSCAFFDCGALKSITIPEGVTDIGNDAFSGCAALTGLTIPQSVQVIYSRAFSGCKSLTSLTIPQNVTDLDISAFDSCVSLTNIRASAGNPEYSDLDGVLFNKAQTILLVYPAGRPGSYAIPEGVTTVPVNVFRDCTSLTELSFPASLTDAADAMLRCGCLTRITVSAENRFYSDVDGVLFSKDKTELLRFPAGRSGAYAIPDGTARIGEEAFHLCRSVTDLTIPDSVTSIGRSALEDTAFFQTQSHWKDGLLCLGSWVIASDPYLTEASIPDGTVGIADYAFESREELLRVTIPGSVRSIGSNAFCFCGKLPEVILPEGVRTLGEAAFSDCAALTRVTIPGTVERIPDWTFYFSEALTDVTIGEGVREIGRCAFCACRSLPGVSLPGSVKTIGSEAFNDCTALARVELSEGLSSIGEAAFFGCVSLEALPIPESVTEIGNIAFSYCSALESVHIPAGLTSLGAGVFSDCDSLAQFSAAAENPAYCASDGVLFSRDRTELIQYPTGKTGAYKIPDGVVDVWPSAFRGGAVTEVTIPDSVRQIAESAFYGCADFKTAIIPDGVERIGDKAFRNCASLTDASIPGSVNDLGNEVFADCTALQNVTLPENLTGIPDSTFEGCAALAQITIPNGVTEIGYHAFYGCTSLLRVSVPDSVTWIGSSAFGFWRDEDAGRKRVEGFRLIGGRGSAAERYAKQYGFLFVFSDTGTQFTDVKPDAYYVSAVVWAVDGEITNGTGETTFSPGRDCTRGQVVTFLWRANGSPEPKKTNDPFADVKEKDFCYRAVLWAVENGITTGVGNNAFGPKQSCTRGQVVTFLWRASGSPEPTKKDNPFHDVQEKDFFYKAVLWAVEKGVTTGTSSTEFSPKKTCTRGQVVTFLYREQTSK